MKKGSMRDNSTLVPLFSDVVPARFEFSDLVRDTGSSSIREPNKSTFDTSTFFATGSKLDHFPSKCKIEW